MLIQTTGSRRRATSASRVTTPARSACATFAYGNFHEIGAAVPDDVPPVLHLGGVVRDDGHLPRRHPAFHGPRDWAGVWRHGHCRARLTIFYGHAGRPLHREREAAGGPASHRRGAHVGNVAANDLRRVLSAPHSLCSVLHADPVAHE